MDNTLYIFTSNKVGNTGDVSWKFIFDMKPRPSKEDMVVIVGLPFGYVWIPDRHDLSYSFNVWESGKGLLVGGGWTPAEDSESWQKEMHDALPSCALLMTTEVFEWLKENIFVKYGRPFKRYHSETPLLTNG